MRLQKGYFQKRDLREVQTTPNTSCGKTRMDVAGLVSQWRAWRRNAGSELPPRWKLGQDHLQELKVFFCLSVCLSACLSVSVSVSAPLADGEPCLRKAQSQGDSGGGSWRY